jgi:hypothetical protein
MRKIVRALSVSSLARAFFEESQWSDAKRRVMGKRIGPRQGLRRKLSGARRKAVSVSAAVDRCELAGSTN